MRFMIMGCHKTFFLFFFICFLCFSTAEAQTFYLEHACSTDGNFTANSAYQSDLTTLFSSLTSNAVTNAEFYNTTVAKGGDTVYGLFMCRGDVTLQLCHECVVDASQRIRSECRFSKEAIIWYHQCLLRNSNYSFFSTVDTSIRNGYYNTANMTNQERFMRLLFDVMNKTAAEAAKPAVGKKKYETTRVNNISGSQTLYCVAQCTPDLSPQDCRKCLSVAIGNLTWCCQGSEGGRILFPSCIIRYELYPFYRSLDQQVVPAPAPAPAALPPTASSSYPQGKGHALHLQLKG
ncbi:cysteine-rich receptor-like protein kinase 10 [Prosopis cineraria]|uniref:cysteine-rich receptor-like protein kinase 10 n=1 Tax=Prosopis cineraria TaxID=364024 RepID=UPI00240FD9AB|nr:cysteine-rich receptor-like protein kinase 10 [Prosopis cineraria]XP_054779357.1 cysteine-rich receptor-like protein kinase 10 [Prosopis cineraria]